MAISTTANLTTKLEDTIRRNLATVTQFHERFMDDPVHSLTWGADTFEAAVKLRMARQILEYVQEQKTIGKPDAKILVTVERYVLDQVLEKGAFITTSTSPTSNLCAAYTAKAWAVMYKDWFRPDYEV